MPLWKVMISTYKVRFLAVCAFLITLKKETVAKHSTFDSGGGALSLAACTQEELPGNQDKAQQLTFSVTDGGYTSAVRKTYPYCGEWLPNQVFRSGACGLYVVGHSNSLFQRETDSREGCRHGRSRMEKLKVRHRPSQAGCWTNTIISTIPIRHEPQYWGRAAVRLHHYGERVNRASTPVLEPFK